MAALWVEDRRGRRDVDFCKVKVYTRGDPERVIPHLFVTFSPAGEVPADYPVSFRIWPQSAPVADIRVDFGDGTIRENYRPFSAVTHRFAKAGVHVVTVTGTAGGLPVAQCVKVLVRQL
jgi:hypothetical protein